MHHFKLNQAITQNRGSAALNLVLSTKKKKLQCPESTRKWNESKNEFLLRSKFLL